MNKKLSSTLLAVVLTAGSASFANPAQASIAKDCRFLGVTNFYVGQGEDIDIGELLGSQDITFRDFRCSHNGMRIHKVKTNTEAEYVSLKSFAKTHSRPDYPTLFCTKKPNHGRMIDLAYFFLRPVKKINKHEKENYKSWVSRYADNHNCKIFR